MTDKNLPATTNDQAVIDTLQKQSPLHGAMGRVYERLGGEEKMLDWAEEHYGEFLKILVKLAPPPQPDSGGGKGDVIINLPNSLAPGPLDGKVVSEQ